MDQRMKATAGKPSSVRQTTIVDLKEEADKLFGKLQGSESHSVALKVLQFKTSVMEWESAFLYQELSMELLRLRDRVAEESRMNVVLEDRIDAEMKVREKLETRLANLERKT